MSGAESHHVHKAAFYCRDCGEMWCEDCACSCFRCECPCHGDEFVVHE
jgi:hypothetical protein